MGRINQLTPTTVVTTDSVIAVDTANGGVTNKLTINTLAGGLRVIGNYATQAQLAAKQDVLTFDDSPEEDSDNPVTSGGIYNAIGSAMSNVYTKAETDNAIAQSTAIDTHTAYAPTYCYEVKCGKVVTVYGHSAGGLTLTGNNSWQTLTTLPAGFRPTTDVYGVGASAAGAAITFHVAPNGLVEWVAGTGVTTSYWNFGLVFVAAD